MCLKKRKKPNTCLILSNWRIFLLSKKWTIQTTFCLYLSLTINLQNKNGKLRWDLNSDRWSGRQTHWPLDFLIFCLQISFDVPLKLVLFVFLSLFLSFSPSLSLSLSLSLSVFFHKNRFIVTTMFSLSLSTSSQWQSPHFTSSILTDTAFASLYQLKFYPPPPRQVLLPASSDSLETDV